MIRAIEAVDCVQDFPASEEDVLHKDAEDA